MIFNLNSNSEVVNLTAENVKYKDGNVAQELGGLDQSIAVLEDELTANGQRIYLDYKDGKYGYNTDALRGADTFSPFKSGDSDSEIYTNLTTVGNVTGDQLPTINGSGYMILRFKSGSAHTIDVFIDGSISAFRIGRNVSYTHNVGDYWKFYFNKSISFSGGKNANTYLYQTLLADGLVDKKYNILQGATVVTNQTTITGKGRILISQPASNNLTTLYYSVDKGAGYNFTFIGYQCAEFMFNESFTFSSNNETYPFYYIAYVEL